MKNEEKYLEQEQLMYANFNQEQKRTYFVGLFIGEIVSELIKKRKQYHLTQKQVADAMHVKQSYVSRIENLQKIPTLETIGKYLFAINYSIEEQLSFIKMVVDIEKGDCPLGKLLKKYRHTIVK